MAKNALVQSLLATSCQPRVYSNARRNHIDPGKGMVSLSPLRLAERERAECPTRVHEGALRVGVGVITESNLS